MKGEGWHALVSFVLALAMAALTVRVIQRLDFLEREREAMRVRLAALEARTEGTLDIAIRCCPR